MLVSVGHHAPRLLDASAPAKLASPIESNSGASSDEAVAILPKRTRVIVTGNNRTKRALIGQEAVVKKAVGLGGWHFLVLANGEEVKLQRNALSVLEYGPDDQQDSSSDEMTEAREPQIEILTRPRIRRPPKALSPAPEIFKPSGTPHMRAAASHHYVTAVNLTKLDPVALRRYWRVFQLSDMDAAAPGDDLLGAVQRHFATQVVEEGRVLSEFKGALRRRYKQQLLLAQQFPSQFAHLQEQLQPHHSHQRQLGHY